MADSVERFLAAYDTVADFNGYLDADIVRTTDARLLGVSVESDALGSQRRLTFRHYFQESIVPNRPCGIHGYVESEDGAAPEGKMMYAFAQGQDENTAYYYQEVPDNNAAQKVLGLIESALGRMLVDGKPQ